MPTLNQTALSMREEDGLELRSSPQSEVAWVHNTSLLWNRRRLLLRVAGCALLLSAAIAFMLPKEYESTTRIMPPEQPGGGAALIAALSGKAGLGNLGALAGSLFGVKNSSALFVDLLKSGSIKGHLVDQFGLQKIYWKRYRQDTIKKLGRRTDVSEDRKSGVITITVTDNDRQRARDLAQAYLDQLDALLIRVNTSAARREREFIEQRLISVRADLEKSQMELSDFSSKNTTLDVKEQTKAMVEAGAKLQGELIAGRSELDSLEQIYGNSNVRVRATRARVGELEHELQKMTGSSDASSYDTGQNSGALYPPLRQLPILAVRWADLYRKVRVSETVFELLTQQYEAARIEEAKSIATVSVIDPPGWPEKKSFPPRLIIILVLTAGSVFLTSGWLLSKERWLALDVRDPRKLLAEQMWSTIRSRSPHFPSIRGRSE
jgi:uncharacterized protein involved in exopolysaccharide biosynthesis